MLSLQGRVLVLALAMSASTAISTSLEDFFPDINGNLTKITWAHAVNNHTYLNNTLNDDSIMMIEADIVLGQVDGMGPIIPIMAHPPENVSDLSLTAFLLDVKTHNLKSNKSKKGVKLDFKTIEVFLSSIEIVQFFDEVKFPIWINADIIPGPINATTLPVDPDQFLAGAAMFPNAILSIGWTTLYGSNSSGSYNSSQIQQMKDVIKANNVTQEITFPVRAGLAAESESLLVGLLGSVANSTLTVWHSEGDAVDIEKLRSLIGKVGISRVYVDVPEDVLSKLHLEDLPNKSGLRGGSLGVLGFALLVGLLSVVF